MGDRGQAQLRSLALKSNSLQTDFLTRVQGLQAADTRFQTMDLEAVSGQNMSAVLLAAAQGYNKNKFFDDNIAALHAESGHFMYVRPPPLFLLRLPQPLLPHLGDLGAHLC